MATIQRDGYSILPGVLTAGEIEALIAELSKCTARRSRAGIRHALGQASVKQIACDRRLMQISREVLGPAAFPFEATVFSKTQAANWLVVWHQDTALPIENRRDVLGWGPWSVKEDVVYAHAPASALNSVLALRIHLDDSTLENGPLRVLPGTHELGVLTDETLLQLSEDIPHVDGIVPRGGVLVMRPLLVHSSSKSQVLQPRRVLHIEYAGSPAIGGGLHLAVA